MWVLLILGLSFDKHRRPFRPYNPSMRFELVLSLTRRVFAGPRRLIHQRILILDFGAQYTQLIARRVRECGVYCELHRYDVTICLCASLRLWESFFPAGRIR